MKKKTKICFSHSYKSGEVVYVKSDDEYMRFISIFDVAKKEALLYNPRWDGREIHKFSDIRILTEIEKGAKVIK